MYQPGGTMPGVMPPLTPPPGSRRPSGPLQDFNGGVVFRGTPTQPQYPPPPPPQDAANGVAETATGTRKYRALTMVARRDLLLIFGVFTMLLSTLLPLSDAISAFSDPAFGFFLGVGKLWSIVVSCLLYPIVYAVGVFLLFHFGKEEDKNEKNALWIALGVTFVLGLQFMLMAYAVDRDVKALYTELETDCGGGPLTSPLYNQWMALEQLRQQPSCVGSPTVELCAGYEYTTLVPVLKSFETKYRCSSFCANSDLLPPPQVPAANNSTGVSGVPNATVLVAPPLVALEQPAADQLAIAAVEPATEKEATSSLHSQAAAAVPEGRARAASQALEVLEEDSHEESAAAAAMRAGSAQPQPQAGAAGPGVGAQQLPGAPQAMAAPAMVSRPQPHADSVLAAALAAARPALMAEGRPWSVLTADTMTPAGPASMMTGRGKTGDALTGGALAGINVIGHGTTGDALASMVGPGNAVTDDATTGHSLTGSANRGATEMGAAMTSPYAAAGAMASGVPARVVIDGHGTTGQAVEGSAGHGTALGTGDWLAEFANHGATATGSGMAMASPDTGAGAKTVTAMTGQTHPGPSRAGKPGGKSTGDSLAEFASWAAQLDSGKAYTERLMEMRAQEPQPEQDLAAVGMSLLQLEHLTAKVLQLPMQPLASSYPRALFSDNAYEASCDGSVGRAVKVGAGSTSALLLTQGIIYAGFSVLVGGMRLLGKCRGVEDSGL